MQYPEAKQHIISRLEAELPKELTYHSIHHVYDVCDAAIRIAESEGIGGDDLTLIKTAAMYHDSGFIIQSKNHEEISCDIAADALPQFGYTKEQINIICGMIRATKIPQQPQNLMEQIISDADLDYLGRDDFYSIGDTLFTELRFYGFIKTREEWDKVQVNFLQQHHFFTNTAKATRQKKKQAYLHELIKKTKS